MKQKQREMRIEHGLKVGDGIELDSHRIDNEIRSVYWATFGLIPSSISWTITGPRRRYAYVDLLVERGFGICAFQISSSQRRRRTPWGNPEDPEMEVQIFASFERRAILCVSENPSQKNMTFSLYADVAAAEWAKELASLIPGKVGSSTQKGHINLLTSQYGDFALSPCKIENPKLDLALNYGSDFIEVDNDITDFIKSSDPGLVLLHGVTGSGKSTYIYHLANVMKKLLIFIPNGMVASLSSPGFLTFLMDKAKGAVLIIEDAEKVLLERGGGDDSGVSTLLNISDGVLSKVLGIKVICTFNVERAKLDTALLRKGRLRKEHEFKELSAEDANRLLRHLGKERLATGPMTLAEIYNEKGGAEAPSKGPVGFQNN